MRKVGAYDAKTHLPGLLDAVARGERIVITRRGKPVAMLVPAAEGGELTAEEAIAWLRAFPKVRLGQGETIRQYIEEGRRF